MIDIRLHRRLRPDIVFFVCGIFLTVAACGILAAHARLFSQKRDTAVMIGTQLPELASSVSLLAASVEAERLFAQQALAAREEQASVYILPESSPVARSISLLQELSLAAGSVMQRAKFDSVPVDAGTIKTWKGIATFDGEFRAIANIITILGFSGDMMIRDVLSIEDQDVLLRVTESVAPLSLREAEDFLYLDLVEYAADPDSYEQRLFRDMPTDVMQSLRVMLLDAGLARIRIGLGDIAPVLLERKLWPMPLLRVTGLQRDGKSWLVRLEAYSR